MATEQPKTHEHPFQQIQPYPPGAYPPPGTYPQYYPYPPPPADANAAGDGGTPSGPMPGAPFVMPYPAPHAFVYAVPHHHPPPPPPPPAQGQPFQPYSTTLPAAPQFVRPKRKQVKMACTNCATACKRCDEHRPCDRCTKFGLAETCVDGQRKERKKGIKRGPYKRKNKSSSGDYPPGAYSQQGPEGEWNGQASPSSVTTTAAIHAVAQFSPEGYQYYYPPPPGFMPPMGDGQQHPPPPAGSGPAGVPEGGPNVNGQQQPPMVPYYVHHPGGYAPFPYYPHPGPGPGPGGYPPTQQPGLSVHPPPPAMDPAVTTRTTPEAQKKSDGPVIASAGVNIGATKKKSAKGGAKTKKGKRNQKGAKEDGGAGDTGTEAEG